MRVLANVQVGTSQDNAALSLLALMEQQYQGTWHGQYAHMHVATILERRKGDVQAALAQYQESLRRYPNHHFSGFIRSEISRLQSVVEEQLIQDALQDLAKAKTNQCDRPDQWRHDGAEQIGFKIISDQGISLSAVTPQTIHNH